MFILCELKWEMNVADSEVVGHMVHFGLEENKILSNKMQMCGT